MAPAAAPSNRCGLHRFPPAVWIAGRDAEELYLTAVSEAELLCGVAIVPVGRRRNELEVAMLRQPDTGFAERIPPFDSAAARDYADIAAGRRSAGRPIAPADCQIATIARCRRMAVATHNLRDFGDIGIEVIDPWTAASRNATEAWVRQDHCAGRGRGSRSGRQLRRPIQVRAAGWHAGSRRARRPVQQVGGGTEVQSGGKAKQGTA